MDGPKKILMIGQGLTAQYFRCRDDRAQGKCRDIVLHNFLAVATTFKRNHGLENHRRQYQ